MTASAGNLTLGGSVGDGTVMSMKLPAGSYGSGATVDIFYLDTSFNPFFNTYPIAGEIAVGDQLVDTVNSPVLLNRNPPPGTYCAKQGQQGGVSDDGSGGTKILTQVSVSSDARRLQSLTIAGKPVSPVSTTASAQSLLPLGTWPLEIVATAMSGDVTSWTRFYTVPSQMQSGLPLGTLVPDGTAPDAPPVGVKLGSTVTLQLAVTSCGRAVSNPNAYAQKPRLVEVSRAGNDLPLATVDPGAEDTDGDIEFQHAGNGVWSLKLKTGLLGTGTFLMKFQAPDLSYWEAILVVRA
jgi:hypothetical protein